jgi:uncharacterized RDD family membrane protein YckC
MSTQIAIDQPVKKETRQDGIIHQDVPHFEPQEPPAPACIIYAGFWIRVDAFLTDFVILYTIGIVSVLALLHGLAYLTSFTLDAIAVTVLIYFLLFDSIGAWLYFALFESSRKQATPGKILLHIKVVDPDGSRISFGRASKRYSAKLLSALTFGIGYFMAGFTPKKQALHDRMADCFVIRQYEEETIHRLHDKSIYFNVVIRVLAKGLALHKNNG